MSLTRRDLEDLWKTGKEYDVSPGGDGSAMAYIRKLGPTQQGTAVRMANAERAKYQLMDEDDPRYLSMMSDVIDLDRTEKIDRLALTDIQEAREIIEQEISEKPEWAEDDRLQSLVDLWESGLALEYSKGEKERSEESEKVFQEIKRFSDEVEERVDAKLKKAQRKYKDEPDEVLNKKIVKQQIDYEASMAWLRTFRMYQILFGVQSLDREPLFENIGDVESISGELFAKLVDAISDLTLPSTEVKS